MNPNFPLNFLLELQNLEAQFFEIKIRNRFK